MCNIIKWNLSYSRFLQYFSKIIILNESESHSIMSTSLWPHGLCSPWNSPGQDSLVGSLSLLQGIFPTQGSNPGLLHCRWILYQLSHKGSPRILEWVACPFSSGSFQPRNQRGFPALQVDSLPTEPQGKPKNSGMGGLSLPQRIFPTQESNQGLLHCRWILYQLNYQGSPWYQGNPSRS